MKVLISKTNLSTKSIVGFCVSILRASGTSSELVPVLFKPGIASVSLRSQVEHVGVKVINLLGFCREEFI